MATKAPFPIIPALLCSRLISSRSPVSHVTGRQVANAQVLLNSAVTEEAVWSLSPFLPTPLFLCRTVGSYRSPRPLRPGPAPALIPERHLVVPGVPSYQEGKPCLGRLSHSPEVTREPGGTAGTEMQPAVYPGGIPALPKDPCSSGRTCL